MNFEMSSTLNCYEFWGGMTSQIRKRSMTRNSIIDGLLCHAVQPPSCGALGRDLLLRHPNRCYRCDCGVDFTGSIEDEGGLSLEWWA